MTTTTDARCDLTELLVDQCAHCRRIPDPPEVRQTRVFEATRAGWCRGCGERFAAGDRVRGHVVSGLVVGVVAECCWDDA